MEDISEEEEKKRLAFLIEEHVCRGASNSETWLAPISREFWLIVSGVFTWINFCPYCGFKPEDRWW